MFIPYERLILIFFPMLPRFDYIDQHTLILKLTIQLL